MKNVYLIITLALTSAFLLIPLLATRIENNTPQWTSSTNGMLEADEDEFKVYITEHKKTVTLSAEEYILGVLAAEMPTDSHIEALKAQTVAAYTFACRRRMQSSKNAEYHLTDSPTTDQAYLSKEARAEKWGAQQKEKEETLLKAVNAVKGEIITYNNEPILSVYHAISPGNTESAEKVWGTAYPYLTSVGSAYDLLSTEYLSEVKLSKEDFAKKLTELGAKVEGEPASYLGKVEKSNAGTVLKITVCGKTFSGNQLREAFNLRSAAFDLTLRDNCFLFSVMGYGHGVGMSQFGAGYMATQGSSYEEILLAYYSGVKISKTYSE